MATCAECCPTCVTARSDAGQKLPANAISVSTPLRELSDRSCAYWPTMATTE